MAEKKLDLVQLAARPSGRRAQVRRKVVRAQFVDAGHGGRQDDTPSDLAVIPFSQPGPLC